jgi:hypothetical protein
MEDLRNDTLGFEKFKIDEQLFSLLNQLLGGYARLVFKSERKSLDKTRVYHFRNRFKEIGKLKSDIVNYTYPQKLSEIEKFKDELRTILTNERTL